MHERVRRQRFAAFAVAAAICGVLAIDRAAGQSSAPAAARQAPIFEVDPTWPKLPNNWVMGVVSAVAVDRRDHVWLLNRYRVGVPEALKDRVAPPVLEFDQAGNFVQAWGGPAAAKDYEWPDQEHCMSVDDKGNVWIGGTAGRLVATGGPEADRSDDMLLKLTSSGQRVLQIGRRGQSKGPKDTANVHGPADVQVFKNEVFVGDEGNLRVIVFDADTGAFKRMWGAFGNAPLGLVPPSAASPAPVSGSTGERGPEQFAAVHSIRVSNDGLVYVADRVNKRIQVFTVDGKYVTQVFINRETTADVTGTGIAFSPDQEQQFMYVADNGNDHIVVMARKTLEVLYRLGKKSANRGSRTEVVPAAPGEFQGVHYLAVDSKGNLYAADVDSGNRVQRFAFKGLSLASR